MTANLMQEYTERSAESAVNAEKLKRSVFKLARFYLWVLVIGAVLINLQYFLLRPQRAPEYRHYLYSYQYSSTIDFQNDAMTLFYVIAIIALIGSIATALLLYSSIKEGLGKFEADVKAGRITELQEQHGASIRKMTEELATEMSILPSHKIRFWKTMSAAQYPSVQQLDGGDVNIVLPVNYFLFHQQYPLRSKVILAHELGHVKQQDTDLYLLSEKFYTTVRLLVVPMLIVNLASILVMQFLNRNQELTFFTAVSILLSLGIPLFFIIFFIGQYRQVKAMRKQSEHLADMCAYIYADRGQLMEVLESLQDAEAKSDIVHPPRQKRITYIQQIEQSLNLQS